MATNPTVTVTTLSEDDYQIKVALTGSFVDTQETGVVKVDASTFHNINPSNGIIPYLSIVEVESSVSSGLVQLLWDASSPVLALQLGAGANTYLNFHQDSPLVNKGGAGVTGDIKLTTVGIASGGTYQILLTLRKEPSSFTTAPIVTAASFVDGLSGTYVTGNTIQLMLTFNQVVFSDGTGGQVVLHLTSGDVVAKYQGNVVVSSHATGDNTKYMVFQYTVQAGDGADAGGVTLGDLSGIRGSSIGALPAINVLTSVDVSGFTVNPPAVASVGGITNGHHYISGDPITVTAHFNEPVVVTGTPQIPVVIHLTTRQASYVSGSGTNALVFTYTPVVSGDVASAGQFSISSPIGLNSGTIKGNGANSALSFTPPTTTTVLVN